MKIDLNKRGILTCNTEKDASTHLNRVGRLHVKDVLTYDIVHLAINVLQMFCYYNISDKYGTAIFIAELSNALIL